MDKLVTPFLVLCIALIFYTLQMWQLEARYWQIETFENLTSHEKTALRGQIWAIIPSSAFSLVILLLFFGSIVDWTLFQFLRLIAVLNAVPFVYIGLSSIKNHVSILTPKGSGMMLTKGPAATAVGLFALIIPIVATICIILFPVL